MDDDELFVAPPATAERRAMAAAAGWPDGLIERIAALRWPGWRQDFYLGLANVEQIEREVADRERLASGLQVHEATWEDDERASDLFAHSTERIDEWDVTVERSPNPFAQLRLQENAHMKLVVDRGIAVAGSVSSGRSSLVGGERLSVGWIGGWRVRNGMRGEGFANLLMGTPGSSAHVFGMLTYWYVRTRNANAQGFIAHSVIERAAEEGHRVDKLTATVHHLAPLAAERNDGRVRAVRPSEIERCVELVNATHDGLDLFRPYTAAFLEGRLDDLFWGPKPWFVPEVYGWRDYFVLAEAGEVVACAGLWDRGRDLRERWRNRSTGEETVSDPACVLDFGFLPGRADAMAALLRCLAGRAKQLGRSGLIVPLEHLPDVRAALGDHPIVPEERILEVMGYHDPTSTVTAVVTRPYTDLAYW